MPPDHRFDATYGSVVWAKGCRIFLPLFLEPEYHVSSPRNNQLSIQDSKEGAVCALSQGIVAPMRRRSSWRFRCVLLPRPLGVKNWRRFRSKISVMSTITTFEALNRRREIIQTSRGSESRPSLICSAG